MALLSFNLPTSYYFHLICLRFVFLTLPPTKIVYFWCGFLFVSIATRLKYELNWNEFNEFEEPIGHENIFQWIAFPAGEEYKNKSDCDKAWTELSRAQVKWDEMRGLSQTNTPLKSVNCEMGQMFGGKNQEWKGLNDEPRAILKPHPNI